MEQRGGRRRRVRGGRGRAREAGSGSAASASASASAIGSEPARMASDRLKLSEGTGQELHDGKSFVGRCNTMCPAAERSQREEIGELNLFELEVADNVMADVAGRGSLRGRHAPLAVKKFRRSAAGSSLLDLDSVRDAETLQRTMAHLVDKVLLPRVDGIVLAASRAATAKHTAAAAAAAATAAARRDFGAVYAFVADRFRAVRQDFAVQQDASRGFAEALESQVAVHLFAFLFFADPGDEAAEAEAAASQSASQSASQAQASKKEEGFSFDKALCMGQVAQCLTPLLDVYRGLPPQDKPREGELLACAIMLAADQPDLGVRLATAHAQGARASAHPGTRGWVAGGSRLVAAWRRGSYLDFFAAVQRMPWSLARLCASALLPHAQAVGLERLNKALTSREPVRLGALAKAFPPGDLVMLRRTCALCGLPPTPHRQGSDADADANSDTCVSAETLAEARVVFKNPAFDREVPLLLAWQGSIVAPDLAVLRTLLLRPAPKSTSPFPPPDLPPAPELDMACDPRDAW